MPNQKLAREWLAFAEKNIETALLLNRENHYTDVISIDIQQRDEITHSIKVAQNIIERVKLFINQ